MFFPALFGTSGIYHVMGEGFQPETGHVRHRRRGKDPAGHHHKSPIIGEAQIR